MNSLSGKDPRSQVLEAVVVFFVALGTRAIALEQAGMFDEYYHLLAARSWLATGTFSAPDGAFYDRAAGFTLLVAASIRAFGDTILAARIPSLIAGSLWPVVVYLGVRRIDGRVGAAAIAAGLMIFDPTLLGLSQVTRFYTIHGLLFWVGVFSLYSATGRALPIRPRLFRAALAVAAFAGALHLQVITMIGFGGILAGLLMADSPWIVSQLRSLRQRRLVLPLLATVLAGGVVLAWVNRWAVADLWDRFQWAPYWLHEPDIRYYHWRLQSMYPLLWGLFPLAVLVALGRRLRLTVTCVVAFAIIFIAQSLAASQLPRYLAYALPCLFIVWGLAIRELIPYLLVLTRGAVDRIGLNPRLAPLAVAAVLLFCAVNTPAWLKTLRALNPASPVAPYQTADWAAATPSLLATAGPTTAILSSAGPAALYHLGRLDYEIGATYLKDGPEGLQFGLDPSIGRPIVSTLTSVEAVAACFEAGLVIAQQGHWRQYWAVSDELADWFESSLRPVSLPAESGLRAFVWSGRGERSNSPECPPGPVRPGS